MIIRQDNVLVNESTCFFTSDSEFSFLVFQKKRVGRAMGNETFYGDGLAIMDLCFFCSDLVHDNATNVKIATNLTSSTILSTQLIFPL